MPLPPPDTTPPVITPLRGSSLEVQQGQLLTARFGVGASAVDAVDGVINEVTVLGLEAINTSAVR